MKKLHFILLLNFAVQLQAGPADKKLDANNAISFKRTIKISSLLKKDGYSWQEQFVESIEEGKDKVSKYVAIESNLLTKIDPISGLTPLEIAVKAENEKATQSILALAIARDEKLAINMAMNRAQEIRSETKKDLFRIILDCSFVEDDKK